MMTGVVAFNEAVLHVRVSGIEEREKWIDVVIDTGFNGFLTLPAAFITDLMLPYVGSTRATLADSNEVAMDVFEATVDWNQQQRNVLVLSTDGVPLVGMSMLSGHRVILDVEEGGSVTIEALS